jgi:hypothetical protein
MRLVPNVKSGKIGGLQKGNYGKVMRKDCRVNSGEMKNKNLTLRILIGHQMEHLEWVFFSYLP